MAGDDPALAAAVHHGMHRDDLALFEDADLVGRVCRAVTNQANGASVLC